MRSTDAESCVPIPLLPHPDFTKWNRWRRHRREIVQKKKKQYKRICHLCPSGGECTRRGQCEPKMGRGRGIGVGSSCCEDILDSSCCGDILYSSCCSRLLLYEDPCECCRMGRSGYTCVRHTLCCVNLLFWMIGCGMLGIGVWMHLAYGGYSTLLPTYRTLSADSMCIAAGIMTFLIGFFGCCGSWFQSKCLLRTYFALVIIIFILEFTAGTIGFVYRRQIGEILRKELKIAIQEKYTITNDNGLTEVWDQLQKDFECCGVISYHDWYNSAVWPGKEWVPSSCCIRKFQNDTTCGRKGEVYKWHQNGCYQQMHMWLMERLYIVGIVSVIFAFVQLFGLISAMLIICILSERQKFR